MSQYCRNIHYTSKEKLQEKFVFGRTPTLLQNPCLCAQMSTTYPLCISLGMIPELGGKMVAIETRHDSVINKNSSLLQSVFYFSGVNASQPRH
jgi:hypothetical protein